METFGGDLFPQQVVILTLRLAKRHSHNEIRISHTGGKLTERSPFLKNGLDGSTRKDAALAPAIKDGTFVPLPETFIVLAPLVAREQLNKHNHHPIFLFLDL